MKPSNPALFILSGLIALISSSGCSSFATKSDPATYYSLGSPSQKPLPTSNQTVALGIRTVEIPEYLNRPYLVVRRGEHELDLSQNHLWAEPLDKAIQSALATLLSQKLEGVHIKNENWTLSNQPKYILTIVFDHFEATDNNEVLLQARWILADSAKPNTLKSHHKRIRKPCPTSPPDYGQIVASLHAVLDGFATGIASTVMESEGN